MEEVQDPSLRGRPVLVCVFSGRTDESGVVSTANYIARNLGVRSGMPISLAKKRLAGKDGSFIRIRHEKYEAISHRIMQMVRESVDVLEQSGIDEAFLEITGRSGGDYGKASSIARGLKEKILGSEGLTCSVGIAPNKVVAKIASDFQKPNGLTIITPDETKEFLKPLPVEKLYGVGPKTAQALKGIGVETIGQLADQNPSLERLFGRKLAVYLHDAANGVDEEPVTGGRETTQLSRIITLKKNTRDPEEIFSQLSPAIDDLHSKLLAENRSFKTVSAIAILSDLSTRTKSMTLDAPTADLRMLRDQARALMRDLVMSSEKDLRRAGVRVAELVGAADQSSLTEYFE